MSVTQSNDGSPSALPDRGFVREAQLITRTRKGVTTAGILPFSPATLWRKVKDGTFPAPVKLSEKITAWRVEEVRAWLTGASMGAPITGAPSLQDDRWLEEQLAFEADPANTIRVEAVLTEPHPFVAEARRQVESVRATLERMRTDRLSPRIGPPMRKSERYGPHWLVLERSGLMDLPEILLPLRVSIGAADRALRIWDALLKATSKREMFPSISSRRVRIDVGGVPIQLRLSERMDRAPARRGVMGTVPKIPSGVLRIYVRASGAEKKIGDESGQLLEDNLNAVMYEAYKRAAAERKYATTQAQPVVSAKPKSEGSTAERMDRAGQQLNPRAQEDLEEQLAAEASRWARACAIRNYVANVIVHAPKPCPVALRDWISWASSVADKVDPTLARTGRASASTVEGGEPPIVLGRGLVIPDAE